MSSSPHSRPKKRAKTQHQVASESSISTGSSLDSSTSATCTAESPYSKRKGCSKRQRSPGINEDNGYKGDEIICYGMLQFPVLPDETIRSQRGARAVRMLNSGQLRCIESDSLLASITRREADVLELLYRESIEAELKLTTHKPRYALPTEFVLQAILYGERNTGVPLGDTLEDLGLYLQDPINSLRDVMYWNPQRFYNDPNTRTWTREPGYSDPPVHTEHLNPIDTLKGFTSDVQWTETTGPTSLRTSLHSHQKQALTFLLSRENGWQFDSGHDLWACGSVTGQYINQIDKSTHYESPPEFRGGILADTMGFGKSLSMISLIMYNKTICHNEIGQTSTSFLYDTVRTRATLIVVPASLLDSWESELSRHSRPGSLTWRRHDGRRKITSVTQLEQLDILLVSYPTVLSDWKTKVKNGVLFSVIWHRVVLDEAHTIKNPSAATTEAVLELQAERRWAVTASPVQNRLSELQSLLRFLQVCPYSDKNVFQSHISELWATGEETEAIERLKRLLNALMLRRSGKQVSLPERTDLKMTLKLSASELENYHAVQKQAVAQIDDILASTNVRKSYMNALQKINDLRFICNHGIQVTQTVTRTPSPYPRDWDESSASESLRRFPALGLAVACMTCCSPLEEVAESSANVPEVYLTECLRLYCTECYRRAFSSLMDSKLCPCKSRCGVASVQPPPAEPPIIRPSAQLDHPCKLTALINDLLECSSDKKSIVFSGWNLTLDMANEGLTAAGLRCVQVDGRVKSKERTKLFEKFQSSRDVQVLLLSLSCGAVGLTLTAASRVYLMEPQWNPALEEQALARIHRIGQMQPVTTIRFVVEKTIEEYILTVQDGKKDLIAALLSPSTSTGVSIQRLRELRDLL
ncbi:SWI/SNF-related matrix-associated actin-dependent regulator of chromatin subfamily A member 3-like 1 [Apiospora arundinis]|uniref:SWI/SNF-related matrix-associated actin-dependent regulator of chromatin subfamily A member 3-like 1 n=1 Tax=Apiospora arundinis TaxID=335852 RepID=A0ABR2I108_9PEZI